MEREAKMRFGKMKDYMKRKAYDEPFVWSVGNWLTSKLRENKDSRSIHLEGNIKMLDVGPAIGAISSYLVMDAITQANNVKLQNIELHLCDISKKVIENTLKGDFDIPYELFNKLEGMPKKYVDELTRKIKSAKGKVGKLQKLPYVDGVFDVTVANYVLHHIPNADKSDGATELQRVTKEGGLIFLADECIPEEMLEDYFKRHSGEDVPLAKEQFMPMKTFLKYFDSLTVYGTLQGKEYYAFYGVKSAKKCSKLST